MIENVGMYPYTLNTLAISWPYIALSGGKDAFQSQGLVDNGGTLSTNNEICETVL